MVALKGQQAERFVRSPTLPAVLVYGPDNGLVAERAAVIANWHATGGRPDKDDNAFAVTRVEGDQLASDTGRLADLLGGGGLFSERTVVRLRAGSRNIAGEVEAALDLVSPESALVVEADDLKPSSPLRKLAERHSAMAALPCYQDTPASLGALIDETFSDAGIAIDRQAREALVALLGADRRATRNELEKLVLYGSDRKRIELADVRAVVSDGASVDLDSLADAVSLGDVAGIERELQRAQAEDVAAQALLSAMARHFRRLAEARNEIDRGRTAESAMGILRPRVFFRREQAFRRQLTLWNASDLRRVGQLVGEADFEARRKPALGYALLRDISLRTAVNIRRRSSR
ncbi:MAG: DNA polymerase III subunit delta [Flavobacteriaceae bacterium]